MPRASNRRYPSAECQNPACKAKFNPSDRRQKFCEPQCRINYHNDKRHSENQTRFKDERQARLNYQILARIWNKIKDEKEKTVHRSFLEWDGFNFNSQALIKKNSKTNRPIMWYYDNGLELIGDEIYEIHHKT